MNKKSINEIAYPTTNDIVKGIVGEYEISFVTKLDEALARRGVSQQQLSFATGIRQAAISEFVNGNKYSLNKVQLAAIMIVLRITDIREIFDIQFTEETTKQFEEISKDWITTGKYPSDWVQRYNDNLMKMQGLKE